MIPYSSAEFREIQDAIIGWRKLDDGEEEELYAMLETHGLPDSLWQYPNLVRANNFDLLRRLSDDPVVAHFGIVAFFPMVAARAFSDSPPKLRTYFGNRWKKSERGFVGHVRESDPELIVKPTQSDSETSIAAIVADLGGPAQHASLSGYLTEEFVSGTPFIDLPFGSIDEQALRTLGMNVGELFMRLHSRRILYNDTNIAHDFGQSHVIVKEDLSVRLIDFGVSVDFSNYPSLTDDQLWNLIRFQPMVEILGDNLPTHTKQRLIAAGRAALEDSPVEEHLQRDIDLLYTGAGIVQLRFGVSLAAFLEGFSATYRLGG